MKSDMRKVVILGANGAMGSGAAQVFAAAGIDAMLLARDEAKAQQGKRRAEQLAKSEAIGRHLRTGSYERDLDDAVAEADLIFEAVAEDLALKQSFFRKIDRLRREDAIVATVSSGLSITAMAHERSESFRKHFLGIHLFNPPNVILGCEIVPHVDTDPEVLRFVVDFFEKRLGRKTIKTADTAAFAGNRVGFKVLNEAAQLAPEHGVGFLDLLIGPHTGRAMPPLATIDFVGWDVHKAIVDNLRANTNDEAHHAFTMPSYMADLITRGHMGTKTPEKGGFFWKTKQAGVSELLVLDPASGQYLPSHAQRREPPAFVRRMRELIRMGCYREALLVLMEAEGEGAHVARKIVLGYVSYALGRVGEVVEQIADIDRIMGFGFNWAPPGVIVDMLGPETVISALGRANLPVPKALIEAKEHSRPIFSEPHVDVGRFFYA